MKCTIVLCLLALAAGNAIDKSTPIDMVVSLLTGVAKEIENDGKNEQASYDKYACWVEDTIQRKASDINKAKDLLVELADSIKKLGAEIASHGAEITQLNKDVAQNKEANKEATAIRDKENAEFEAEKTETEQCNGALEAAIKVLTGAGTKKSGFLQQYHEAQLMSVAMGVRKVMQHVQSHSRLSDADAGVVMRFVQNPQQFASEGLVATQTGQNPFGDYAPQSSQIQGILAGMHDAFIADLKKDTEEEEAAQKAFDALIGTKMQELATLEATLQKQETDKASKEKQLAEDNVQRDDTTDSLAADEKFFEETKAAAQDKATEWSIRVRLRTEELAGIEGAVQILSGGAKTFQESQDTFLQLKSVSKHGQSHENAYGKLKSLAAKYQSTNLKKMVLLLQSGGHFDKVMVMIDNMMALLRKEEQQDIAHRDRCENGENANKNSMEDLNNDIKKTDKKLERMGNTDDALEKELKEVESQIVATKKDMGAMLDNRNQENADFKRALKMDAEAIALITQATVRLSKYYKENGIALGLVQADPNTPPKTTFSGAGSRQEESGGIVAILDMIKEDLQKEMKAGRADEEKAQADYEKQKGTLQESLAAQNESKVNLEKQRAGLADKTADAQKFKGERQDDLNSQDNMKQALSTDCDWVATHFDTRRTKRKTEMDGLVEAKNFLAGVEAGDAVLAP